MSCYSASKSQNNQIQDHQKVPNNPQIHQSKKSSKKRRKQKYRQVTSNTQLSNIVSKNEKVQTTKKSKYCQIKKIQQEQNTNYSEMEIMKKGNFQRLLLQFQDQQFNSKFSNKIKIDLSKEYGEDDERLIKKILRQYHQSNNNPVQQINSIYILVNQICPTIQLQYSSNHGNQPNIDIIKLFKIIRKDEALQKEMKKIIRTLFYSNYVQIGQKKLEPYFDAINIQIRYLKAKNYSFKKFQDGNIRSLMSCYCCYDDQVNFVAVDIRWNQIRFNHVLLEINKQKCHQAFKMIKSLQDKMTVNKTKQNQQFIGGGNQQISSDQQECQMKLPNMKTVSQKLNILFKQTLQQFTQQITQKQQQKSQLGSRTHQNKQEQIQKIADQINQLNTNLTNYKEKRTILQEQYSTEKDDQRIVSIYKQIKMLRNQLSSKLPIISKKKQLFELLDKNKLIILEGETGSGKSTQLPQLLCEYYNVFKNKQSKSILLTQPRKLATRTLAARIASQLDENIHGFVDYVSRLDKKPSKFSKIVVMLDRLLLDQLEKDPKLQKYHCLIIDEAHERTLSIDILIGLIKKLMEIRDNFHVIVTSATLDAKLFQSYFNTKTFKVSGRLFPVEVFYKPQDNQKCFTQKIKKVLNNQILRGQNKEKYKGHVLVFCNGIEQINTLCNQYSNRPGIKPLPLHGKLSIQQQRLIFEPEERMTKIIFSTRIAETSVTIDKVKVVIDTGEDRQTVYDQKKKITALQLKPISKSAAEQRKGRAGRTSAGYCFRLYSRQFEQSNMTSNKIPQIKSVPLDTLVLRLKQLKIKDILNFDFIQSPDQIALKQSQERMQIIGCLDDFYQITQIGLLLVKIPIQPFMSRALAEGIIIDSKKPWRAITPKLLKTLVMIVNGQSIFNNDFEQKQNLMKLQFKQFADKQGDFFSLLKVYEAFEQQLIKRNVSKWCKDHYLNRKVLFQAFQLYKQVKQIIDHIKIDTSKIVQFEEDVMYKQRLFVDNKQLILSCILPSFCEELCLYSGNPKIGYTSIKRKVPLQIYGSSFLMLQNIYPKWIVSFEVFKTSNMFCRLAQTVSFQTLQKSVPSRLFKRYKIKQCEKQNPYYTHYQKQLSSLVFEELKKRHYSNTNNDLDFLKQSTLLFNVQDSSIQLFMDKSIQQQLKQKFDTLLLKICKGFQQSSSEYIHHYLGQITSIMASGCHPKTLNFSNILYAVKIMNIQYDYQRMITLFYTKNVIKTEFNHKGLVMYFSQETQRKNFVQWLDGFRKEYKNEFKKVKIRMQKGFDERKDKIASIGMKIRFFIGQRKNTNIYLMGYESEEVQHIKTLIQTNFNQRRPFQIRVNDNGKKPKISIFLPRYYDSSFYDEVDFEEELQQAMKNVDGWKKPYIIKSYRQLNNNLSSTSDQQWVQKIRQLIGDINQDDIFLRGNGPPGTNKYTDYTANIRMYDALSAEKFRKQYNKKKKVLGIQKIHIQIKYNQTLVRVPQYLFGIYHHKYYLKKLEMQNEFPQLKIQTKQIRLRNNNTFILIQSKSPNRQDMVRPSIVIKDVFKPQIVQLNPQQVQILNKKIGIKQNTNRPCYLYQKIFEQLRFEYNYCVELQMPQKSTLIKIHSDLELAKLIQSNLRNKINESKNLMITINYRNKNIYDLTKILQVYQQQHEIFSEILFSQKIVEVFGKIDVLCKLEEQVNALAQLKQKGQCTICDGVLNYPYTLFNCSHTFCRYCLISSIRIASQQINKFPLKCPGHQQCQKLVNINDIKSLFEQQQFDKMCDKGIKRLIDTQTNKYHGCFSQDCEMIFQIKQSQKDGSFKCSLCTFHYCYECKQAYHPKITCAQLKMFSNSDQSDKMLEELGFQKCGNCFARVQKTSGCDHMQCKCGSHFCWKCGDAFTTKKQCENHLISKHGGIFDRSATELNNYTRPRGLQDTYGINRMRQNIPINLHQIIRNIFVD